MDTSDNPNCVKSTRKLDLSRDRSTIFPPQYVGKEGRYHHKTPPQEAGEASSFFKDFNSLY